LLDAANTESRALHPVRGFVPVGSVLVASTVRYGLKWDGRIRRDPLEGNFSGRVEKTTYYNADDAASPTRFELGGGLQYHFTPRVSASFKGKYYTTGSNDPASIETREIDLLFGLVYHLGEGRR